MFDIARVFLLLDDQDIRLTPVPEMLSQIHIIEILKRRIQAVEMILSILDDNPYNSLRIKSRNILHVLKAEYEKLKKEGNESLEKSQVL